MDRELAMRLLPIFNSQEVASALSDYANTMAAYYIKQLVGTTEPAQIYRLQGQIKELQALAGLRDNIVAKAKEKK